MFELEGIEPGIGRQTVCSNDTAIINNVRDEGLKAIGAVRSGTCRRRMRPIRPSLSLAAGNRDNGFFDRFSAFDATLFASDVALVHFYETMK